MINLFPTTIDNFFKNQEHQADVLIDIYKYVFPDWDNIESINGWPSISEKTWEYIGENFIKFDKLYHPDDIAGGCWMNKGFTVNYKLTEDWKVYTNECRIVYKLKEI